MIIIGYFLAVLVGVSLGLVGSGGSILTVPILVYVVGVPASLATTYSLFVVGFSAFVGTLKATQDKMLDYRTAISFGIPSISSIFLVRSFLMPLVPTKIVNVANFTLTKDVAIMLLFAVLMVWTSVAMIREGAVGKAENAPTDYSKIFLRGILVGSITGIVGVGGGFLIIPTLVFVASLPMKRAVATSLLIIATNSFIGFFSSLQGQVMDWQFLLIFSGCSVMGILLGRFLSQFVSNEKLKPAFGWFVLAMGIYILATESVKLMGLGR
ncbi:MAG: sulfite exporter TauE/SafE family protein [Bacteroidetes bacterium]|nr:MAG: sulfite exporter TauE/SafE family protein [Bacteroidota bacterium]